MLLLDSSVWIEVLQGRLAVREIPGDPTQWAVTEPVVMDVLAGASQPDQVAARLQTVALRPVEPAVDYTAAAALFQAARRRGLTIRSLNDCLIAAVALRLGDTVMHRDADFEAIAQVSLLQTDDLRP